MVNIHKIFLPPCPHPHSCPPPPQLPSSFPHRLFSPFLLLFPSILSQSVSHHHSSPPSSIRPPYPAPHLSSVFPAPPVGRVRLLWFAAIEPIGGIGRPQIYADQSEGGRLSNLQCFFFPPSTFTSFFSK